MKKLSKFFMFLIVCMLVMSGCQKKEEETTEEKQAEALEIENKTDDSEEKDNGGEQESEEADQPEQQEDSEEIKTVTIYSPNENADGFVTSQVGNHGSDGKLGYGAVNRKRGCSGRCTSIVLYRNAGKWSGFFETGSESVIWNFSAVYGNSWRVCSTWRRL